MKKEIDLMLKTIKNRRSIRYYKPDPIPNELIETVVQAGNWAPSAFNLQPWRFVVIQDKEIKEKFRKAVVPKWRKIMEKVKKDEPERYFMFSEHLEREDPVYYSAPVIIFIIGPSSINSAFVCENMMLAAHALGLGSCYVGWGALILDEPELVEVLELKGNDNIAGPIVMGFVDKTPEIPNKKEPKVKWV
jgi:nitroreductase